ncbi:MAG: hypothetical protein CL466_12310, partial [Acidimicrobiaceae bacterium]|nr:hypothetical protein [Acidimicrobiaceae bacterium]
KTDAKRSLATPVVACTVTDTAERISLLRLVVDDVAAAARATGIDLVEGDALSADVELEPADD